jgi:hypothetical protein
MAAQFPQFSASLLKQLTVLAAVAQDIGTPAQRKEELCPRLRILGRLTL